MSATLMKPKPLRPSFPDFDLDLLPELLRKMVKSISDQYQIDPVIPFGTALGVIATAMRGKVRSRISPDWIEHPSIYICSIANTGEGKSQVMNLLRQSLIDYEVQIQSEARSRNELQSHEHEIAQSRLKAVKDSMSSIKKSPKMSPASQADLIDAIDLVNKCNPHAAHRW